MKREHDWAGYLFDVCSRCGRTMQQEMEYPQSCISDAEAADRALWRVEAEKAAEAFRRVNS